MKTKHILLAILMLLSSFAEAQVKSKKGTIKKFTKKTYPIKKKTIKKETNNNAIAAVTQEDPYSSGLWSYSKKFVDDHNDYLDEETGEYSTDNEDDYKITFFLNGEEFSSEWVYVENLGDEYSNKYRISINGSYPNIYYNSEDLDNEIEKIVKQYLQRQYSAKRFNF